MQLQLRAFDALRIPSFRYLWLGHFSTTMSFWMETMARSWLVWEMTNDAFLLGLVNLFRAIPLLLFSFPAGIAADRFDRRYILMACQATTMVMHLILAALLITNTVQIWEVFVTAFIAGAAQAFIQPTRQSLVPCLVSKENILQALVLTGAAMNTSRILGPALAGLMVTFTGLGEVYFVQAAIFVFAILSTSMMVAQPRNNGETATAGTDKLSGGFSYIFKHRILLALLAVTLIPMVFGMPYLTLLPVFADEVFGIGASGLGLLTAASGIGSLLGIAIVTFGEIKRKGMFLLSGAFAFGAFLIVLAVSRSLPLSLVALMIVGITNTTYTTMTNSLLLTIAPAELHGRVMSIYMMQRGLVPLGSVLAGAMAARWNAPVATGAMGAVCAILAIITVIVIPQMRDLEWHRISKGTSMARMNRIKLVKILSCISML